MESQFALLYFAFSKFCSHMPSRGPKYCRLCYTAVIPLKSCFHIIGSRTICFKHRKRQISRAILKPNYDTSYSGVQYASDNKDTSNVYSSVRDPTESRSQLTDQNPTVSILRQQDDNEQSDGVLIENIIYEGYLSDGDGMDLHPSGSEGTEEFQIKEQENIGELYSQINRENRSDGNAVTSCKISEQPEAQIKESECETLTGHIYGNIHD